MSLYVTKHAIDRYLEREEDHIANLILDIVKNGERVYPANTQKSAIFLMNNGYADAEYYFYKSLVAVVVSKKVVTVFRRVKGMFISK